MFESDQYTFGRGAIALAGLIALGSIFAAEAEWIWHLLVASGVFLGLYFLPKNLPNAIIVSGVVDRHSSHDQDEEEEEVEKRDDADSVTSAIDDYSEASGPQQIEVSELVSELYQEALNENPPNNLIAFADFCARFRRFPSFNARLIQVQRPGALVAGSKAEWAAFSKSIAPDATPILIMKRFGPIEWVYDVEDTLPPPQENFLDPFPAASKLSDEAIEATIAKLIKNCTKQNSFYIKIVSARLGGSYAGSAAGQGNLPIDLPPETVTIAHELISSDPVEWIAPAPTAGRPSKGSIPHFRVKVNDRLGAAQRLITIAHELGHIFCGHLGASAMHSGQSAWPNRILLGYHEREMEAEAVAWLVGKRAQIVSGSATYLKHHVQHGDQMQVDADVVARAVGRIESLAALNYGARG